MTPAEPTIPAEQPCPHHPSRYVIPDTGETGPITCTHCTPRTPEPTGDTRERVVRAFAIGDRVEKIGGSSWRGVVVGTYSTALTPEGYAVESEREPGSVQIYPAKALRAALPPARDAEVEKEALDYLRIMALNSAQTVGSMRRVEEAINRIRAALSASDGKEGVS